MDMQEDILKSRVQRTVVRRLYPTIDILFPDVSAAEEPEPAGGAEAELFTGTYPPT